MACNVLGMTCSAHPVILAVDKGANVTGLDVGHMQVMPASHFLGLDHVTHPAPPPTFLQHCPGPCSHAERNVIRGEDVFFLCKAEE